jgi:multiple sugar transport system permease protein
VKPATAPASCPIYETMTVNEARGDRRWTLAPTILVFVLLTMLPIVNLLVMSVHEITWVQGSSRWTFAGLKHYLALPDDALFRAGIGNTLAFAAVSVTIQIALGFMLALFVSRIGRGRIIYRTIFILPVLIPGIVIGAIWKLMLNFDFGLVNEIIGLLGAAPRDWLGSRATALAAVIVVDVWHWTPFCFLLLLAGIESLPQDVYEAARVDGATAWGELRFVTLPMMLSTIVVTLVFRLIAAFKVFDEVYLLTGGGPGTATEVISFTVYRRFFTEDRMGHGSALSIVTLFMISLLVVLALAAARRRQTQS